MRVVSAHVEQLEAGDGGHCEAAVCRKGAQVQRASLVQNNFRGQVDSQAVSVQAIGSVGLGAVNAGIHKVNAAGSAVQVQGELNIGVPLGQALKADLLAAGALSADLYPGGGGSGCRMNQQGRRHGHGKEKGKDAFHWHSPPY